MSTQSGQELRTLRGSGWALWILLAVVWFATMPWRPLLDPDEGRYAEIPREMLSSGDWITPRLDGLKYFEKPPLQYWATAATYSVFGLSEWTARLWTVGLGFLCLPMVLAFASRLRGRAAGLCALTALAVSPYFEIVGHLNLLDAGFTFWLTATAFAFVLAQCEPPRSAAQRRWMLLAWGAAALAVLTKGIVVGVLTGASLALYSLVERDYRPWRRLHLVRGGALFLLIALPWFIAVSVRNPSFLKFFFVHEHIARFLTTVHQRVEPWWYFAVLLLIGTLPWLTRLPGSVAAGWRESEQNDRFKPLKFLLIFCVVTLLFFSASGSKLAPYILPIMPPLAVIAAAGLPNPASFIRRTALFTGVLLLLIAVGLVIYSLRRNGYFPHEALPWLLAGSAAALCSVLIQWFPRTAATMTLALATAGLAVLGCQCLLGAYTQVPPQRSAYRLARAVRPLIHRQTELYSLGQYRETLSPYLQRTLQLVQFQGELAFGLSEEPAKDLTGDAFLTHWNQATDAIAFLDPSMLSWWRQHGLKGRVIAGDQDTVAVSRL
ncbi:MAG TPA: phospholipid carrier-dependent glycosyltransferase [Steroidobacteraceae bacterium]|nr:phospholipid carrier-dependent glycosyltransferase [Steroidobacteraceae bacterium]